VPAPVLTVRTPLPLLLPDGVTLTIGAGPPLHLPWRTCIVGACEAALPLGDDLVAELRRARGGTAEFTLVDASRVRLPFSLLGFSAALRALESAPVSGP
jgi:invasion protein IalB